MASNIYLCRVESVFDIYDGCRIKVRIPTIDPTEKADPNMENIPYVFPLLPKHLHVNPRVGEMVFVFLQDAKAPRGERYFIGPVISQQYMLDYDPFNYSAQTLLGGTQIGRALPVPSMDPENRGSVPDRNDIVIQGRQNTEVNLKPSELRLRCGFKACPDDHDPKNRLLNNSISPAYIQMKYGGFTDNENNHFASEINVVADRINLLSHDSRTYFNLTDRDKLINEDELKKIYEMAHPLPYGDTLIAFLKELVRIFRQHTHPYSMLMPTFNSSDRSVLDSNLDELLSKSIRIN